MELIGSRQEQKYREELERSALEFKHEEIKARILEELSATIPKMKSLYVLSWTPEQDIIAYCVLLNTDRVAYFDVHQGIGDYVHDLQIVSVNKYRKGLSRINQIKLAVAIDLAKQAE